MTRLQSEFLRAVAARGQFHQCTDLTALDAARTRAADVSETARRLNMHRRTLLRILAKRAPR